MGKFGDISSGGFLVIDTNTYGNSLKEVLFSLGLLNLQVIPLEEITTLNHYSPRKRPPGLTENMRWNIEVDYKSNVDFVETVEKLHDPNISPTKRNFKTNLNKRQPKQKMKFKTKENQPSQTEASTQLIIKEIDKLPGTTFNLSCKGTIQITCFLQLLGASLKWLFSNVKVLPRQQHLVLIPTRFAFNIHNIFDNEFEPTDELIEHLGSKDYEAPVIFPLGWITKYFFEDKQNPLQKLFPAANDFEALRSACFRKRKVKPKKDHKKLMVNADTSQDHYVGSPEMEAIKRYLGAESTIWRRTFPLVSDQLEDDLLDMWSKTRTDEWQWVDGGFLQGKVVLQDIVIDTKKNPHFNIGFRKYTMNDPS